jgi:hypothetical protein
MKYSQATEWRPTVAHGETVGFVVHANPAPERGERNAMSDPIKNDAAGRAAGKSGGGPPQSKTLRAARKSWNGAKRLGVRQSSGALLREPRCKNNPNDIMRSIFRRVFGALTALVLFSAVGARAETTNTLSDAEIQGRELAQQLCEAKPQGNLTNTGIIKTRYKSGIRTELRFRSQIITTATNWFIIYESLGENYQAKFKIEHSDNKIFRYELRGNEKIERDATFPFAGSDFWLGDLSLEFFHWPVQKMLPNPTNLKLGRSYKLLESTNPNPPTNGYSRVLSWVDRESGGLLQAEAYDAKGKRLKIFEPKSFKKVNGQLQVEEIRMRNDQTESSTRLEFDLKKN